MTKTSSDQTANLRKQAEKIAREKAFPDKIDKMSPADVKRTIHELRVHQIELDMQNEALRLSQAELEVARKRYFDLYDLAPVGYITVSEKGMILEANINAANLLGMAKKSLVGQLLTSFVIKEDQDIYYHHRKDLFETDKPQTFELRMVKKNGTAFWAHLEATVQDSLMAEVQAGTPELRIVLSDITARKQAEEALYETNAYLENLINYANAPIIVWDPQLRITRFNHAFENLTGRSEAEVLGKSLDILFPTGLVKESMELIIKTTAGDRLETVEIKIMHLDGTVHTLLWNSATIYASDGQTTIATIAQGHNITHRKQMEEELLRAQKLESIGVLAGGIAHDFNNLMTVVQGYIELAIMELPASNPSQKMLLTAMSSVHKTQDLTSKLITFSRGGGPVKESLDVTAILQNAVNIKIKETKVRVKYDFMDNLWPAEADELQMKQCFFNLTTNAVEAMPEEGNLTITVENALMPSGEIHELVEGSYLKITFSDEGSGIPAELHAKIFDPYFTTKKMGAQQGLGLGLAVCHSVMKKHGGHIAVKSSPGKGAAFVLYLPARPDLAEALPGKKEIKTTSSTSKCRTLIMDDEPQIREIERIYLERMGHEVTDVKDGQEAIDAYKIAFDAGNPFDLVMLDLTVRHGMGGQEAMACLLTIDPKIKAIIASGFVDDPLIEYYADYGFKGALKKPFRLEDVKSIVEKILKPKGENRDENINS